jgi:hypothetical protein
MPLEKRLTSCRNALYEIDLIRDEFAIQLSPEKRHARLLGGIINRQGVDPDGHLNKFLPLLPMPVGEAVYSSCLALHRIRVVVHPVIAKRPRR